MGSLTKTPAEIAMGLFDDLPCFPVALPEDELALLAKLAGCEWPTNTEIDWQDRPAARRLEKRGLIKISRQKDDPIAVEPTWYAGKLPASAVRASLLEGERQG